MQKIQVGLIGLGGIGRQFLAEMQAHERFSVADAWDPSETARAAAAAGCPGRTGIDRKDPRIAAPTPNGRPEPATRGR